MKGRSTETPPPYGPRDPASPDAPLPPEQRIRPALTWFLIGAVTAAVVGWLTLLLATEVIGSEEERIAEIKNQAAQSAYSLAIDGEVAAALDDQIIMEIARQISVEGIRSESAWADGFWRGWSDGWDDALDAMRSASIEAGIGSGSSEFAALDAAPRRNVSR